MTSTLPRRRYRPLPPVQSQTRHRNGAGRRVRTRISPSIPAPPARPPAAVPGRGRGAAGSPPAGPARNRRRRAPTWPSRAAWAASMARAASVSRKRKRYINKATSMMSDGKPRRRKPGQQVGGRRGQGKEQQAGEARHRPHRQSGRRRQSAGSEGNAAGIHLHRQRHRPGQQEPQRPDRTGQPESRRHPCSHQGGEPS